MFLRELGVDAALEQSFGHLKTGPGVQYRMGSQMRLLMDAACVGEERVAGLESLAADALFCHLAGGTVPSIDTVYRDLCRFDEPAIATLHEMVAEHGVALIRRRRHRVLHLDVDTTVMPLFGAQEGALPGPNPHYHARPSYHPILARVAEVNAIVGAELRPGNTAFGAADIPFIMACIDRVRAAAPSAAIYVRIDGAGDCSELIRAIMDKGCLFVIKARMTRDLSGAVSFVQHWRTVDWDVDGRPRRQVAEVPFRRAGWPPGVRVIAVRTLDRASGKHIYLWEDNAYTVQVYLTNEQAEAPEDVAQRYNLRAGIEPLIGELKHGWGCGKMPSQSFVANHAAMLLKMLTFNLLRRFVFERAPQFAGWESRWIRRALILIPGILVRSGRRSTLRVAPHAPPLHLNC